MFVFALNTQSLNEGFKWLNMSVKPPAFSQDSEGITGCAGLVQSSPQIVWKNCRSRTRNCGGSQTVVCVPLVVLSLPLVVHKGIWFPIGSGGIFFLLGEKWKLFTVTGNKWNNILVLFSGHISVLIGAFTWRFVPVLCFNKVTVEVLTWRSPSQSDAKYCWSRVHIYYPWVTEVLYVFGSVPSLCLFDKTTVEGGWSCRGPRWGRLV